MPKKKTDFNSKLTNSIRIGQYPNFNIPKELKKLEETMSPLTCKELTNSIEVCKKYAEEIGNSKKKKAALRFIEGVELIIKDFTSAREKESENQKAIFENTLNPYEEQKQLERSEKNEFW